MDSIKARAIMSKPARAIDQGSSLAEAAETMLDAGVGSLVVTGQDGRIVGILTDADFGSSEACVPFSTFKAPTLLDRWIGGEGVEEIYQEARRRKIREIMTERVHTVGPDASLKEILDIMLRRGVKYVPVIEGDKPVGIVARHDLLKAMMQRLSG